MDRLLINCVKCFLGSYCGICRFRSNNVSKSFNTRCNHCSPPTNFACRLLADVDREASAGPSLERISWRTQPRQRHLALYRFAVRYLLLGWKYKLAGLGSLFFWSLGYVDLLPDRCHLPFDSVITVVLRKSKLFLFASNIAIRHLNIA